MMREWPPKSTLDPAIYGSPESAITTEMIEKLLGGNITADIYIYIHEY